MATRRKVIIIFLCLACSTLLSVVWKPTPNNTKNGKPHLSHLLPQKIGDWKTVTNQNNTIINPDVSNSLNKTYTDTFNTVYSDSENHLIMVSLAYTTTIDSQHHIHRPEVCYPSQGFITLRKHAKEIKLNNKTIQTIRLVAQQNQRTEPITYWIKVGDSISNSNIEQFVTKLKYGIQGILPDGMLIRISTIENNETQAYLLEEKFITELYEHSLLMNKPIIFGN